GEIERHGQAVLARIQEEAVALVRLDGGAEAGVLAHRPEPLAMHLGMDAAGERELARRAEVRGETLGRRVRRPVDRLERSAPRALELALFVFHRLASPTATARTPITNSPRLRLRLAHPSQTRLAYGCGSHTHHKLASPTAAARTPITNSPRLRLRLAHPSQTRLAYGCGSHTHPQTRLA